MREWITIATATFLTTGSIWLFQNALSGFLLDAEAMRWSIINETVLTVGQPGPCSTQVHLSVWESMNQLEVYRWVIACEDARVKGVM